MIALVPKEEDEESNKRNKRLYDANYGIYTFIKDKYDKSVSSILNYEPKIGVKRIFRLDSTKIINCPLSYPGCVSLEVGMYMRMLQALEIDI